MKQAVLLVSVFLCCFSFKDGSSEESCPNAKNSIENDNVKFWCSKGQEDPCNFNIKYDLDMLVDFKIGVQEEPVFYEVLFTGDGINATASGKADIFEDENSVEVLATMEGDMPVGHNGTVTVSLYFNEEKKDIPDWCARTNLTIVNREGKKIKGLDF